MNARQQWVTAVMGMLMLATIFAMPAHDPRKSGSVLRQSGPVSVAPETRAELPADQVKDLTYN